MVTMRSMVIRHTVYNAVGLIVPIVVAIATIPILIKSLGLDRFGLLTLIWAIVSYFGVFDLGLGRALTQQLSVLMVKEKQASINSLLRTSLVLLLFLGLLAGLVLLGVTPLLAEQIKGKISSDEVTGAIHAMAFALPFIVVTSGVRGALEANHCFGILNVIRLPMGIINFVGPVVIALYGSGRIDDISWLLAYARSISFTFHFYYMCKVMPGIFSRMFLESQWLRALITNGGWMTVSNIASPLLSYLDRFIVGFLLPASFVAYYATPQELILKVYIIPGALTAVLFPRFAAAFISGASKALYWKSVYAVSVLMAVFCLFNYFFAFQILETWISTEFAINSFMVMKILLVGVLFGTISSIPYTYLQAIGRAKIGAISHVVQVPFFLALSYKLTLEWGIEGAALAWSVRLAIDAVVLFFAVNVVTKQIPNRIVPKEVR